MSTIGWTLQDAVGGPLSGQTSPNAVEGERFMNLLMAMNDTRKRIFVLTLLCYIAMC